jgi:predicted NBD/HSP70 family sugar kinase
VNHNPAHYRVYEGLRDGEVRTKPEIAQKTGLSLPAVITASRRLERVGLLRTTGEKRGGSGRPSALLRSTPENHSVLAIDLGGTTVRAALTDLHGTRVRELESLPLLRLSNLGRCNALKHLREVAAEFPEARRVGIAAPGIVTPQGTLRSSWLFGADAITTRSELEDWFGKPVRLENDANSAAWGEFRRGRGGDHFAYVNFVFGIGAGIVADGALLRGSRGAAGELSYLAVRLEDVGHVRVGALAYEYYAALRTAASDLPDWETRVFASAARGDAPSQAAVAAAVRYIAHAISSLLTVLDVERIVLRDEFPELETLVLQPMRVTLKHLGLPAPLELSVLGRDAGLIGVGLLVAEELERELLECA